MALTGKLETEVEVHSSAAKFFNLFVTQLHDIQNITDTIHGANVHEGDWHSVGSASVKHWTYTIGGKVRTCKEHIEEIDEENKLLTLNLFDGDVAEEYNTLKAKLQLTDKPNDGALAKCTYEYEKVHEGIPPPQAYLDFITKLTQDVDAHLIKA